MEELRVLLVDSLDIEDLVLEPHLLGGWTNINLGVVINSKLFTLKLPGITDFESSQNPFDYEFSIHQQLANARLCPRPFRLGTLGDDSHLPYALYEYVQGIVLYDLFALSETQMHLLSKGLDDLRSQVVENVATIDTASMYVNRVSLGISPLNSSVIDKLIERFQKCRDSLLQDYSDEELWPKMLTHGDHQPSNLVFTSERVIFLDLEACAYAHPSLDLSYLLVQSPVSRSVDSIRGLVKDVDSVTKYIPLALLSVISWTLKRISLLHKGIIEENLLPLHNLPAMLEYVRTKLAELELVLKV
jgi:aminoglycoside phosphotransferase (APT) family kinase protein